MLNFSYQDYKDAMNITRRERVIGFILAGTGTHAANAPALEIVNGLSLLRKCIANGTVEPTPANDPPADFLIESDTTEYLDYPSLVAARSAPRISPVLLCLPLALLLQKSHIGLNIAAITVNPLEGMACATICFAMHFGIHVDNSLFAIATLLNTTLRLVLSQSNDVPRATYQLASNCRLDTVTFDGSALSVMSVCLWSLRELNRLLVRWEIDTDRNHLPNLAEFYRQILQKINAMTTDDVYSHCAGMMLACYIGQRYLPPDTSVAPDTSQRVRRFLHTYLKYSN